MTSCASADLPWEILLWSQVLHLFFPPKAEAHDRQCSPTFREENILHEHVCVPFDTPRRKHKLLAHCNCVLSLLHHPGVLHPACLWRSSPSASPCMPAFVPQRGMYGRCTCRSTRVLMDVPVPAPAVHQGSLMDAQVYYREQASSMYNPWAFGFVTSSVETPYILAQVGD